MNPSDGNNNKPPRTIMIGSDFFGGRRDSLDSQQSPDSRRGSAELGSAPSMGAGSGDATAAQQKQRQQHRARFWGNIGAAQVDCSSAPFSA
jgi:hypothetical protein